MSWSDDRRRLVARRPVLGNAHRADRRGVDDALGASLARRLEHVARAVDVGAVELAWIRRPEPIVGGDVIDVRHPAHRRAHRGDVQHVTLDDLDRTSLEGPPVAAGARENPHAAPSASSSRTRLAPTKPVPPVTSASTSALTATSPASTRATARERTAGPRPSSSAPVRVDGCVHGQSQGAGNLSALPSDEISPTSSRREGSVEASSRHGANHERRDSRTRRRALGR